MPTLPKPLAYLHRQARGLVANRVLHKETLMFNRPTPPCVPHQPFPFSHSFFFLPLSTLFRATQTSARKTPPQWSGEEKDGTGRNGTG